MRAADEHEQRRRSPSGEAGRTGASGSGLSTRIGSTPGNVPAGQPVTVENWSPTGTRSCVNVDDEPANDDEVHGVVDPYGPAKQTAPSTGGRAVDRHGQVARAGSPSRRR